MSFQEPSTVGEGQYSCVYNTYIQTTNTYICTHLKMNHAIVKAVTSGDTVLLMSQKAPVNGPPAEKSITLSSLMAPKLGYGDTRPDEPFAFQSREFLRKLLIGKRVQFKVE